jgi:hypothetical protein
MSRRAAEAGLADERNDVCVPVFLVPTPPSPGADVAGVSPGPVQGTICYNTAHHLQCSGACCNTAGHVATQHIMLQHSRACCNTAHQLQRSTPCCNSALVTVDSPPSAKPKPSKPGKATKDGGAGEKFRSDALELEVQPCEASSPTHCSLLVRTFRAAPPGVMQHRPTPVARNAPATAAQVWWASQLQTLDAEVCSFHRIAAADQRRHARAPLTSLFL